MQKTKERENHLVKRERSIVTKPRWSGQRLSSQNSWWKISGKDRSGNLYQRFDNWLIQAPTPKKIEGLRINRLSFDMVNNRLVPNKISYLPIWIRSISLRSIPKDMRVERQQNSDEWLILKCIGASEYGFPKASRRICTSDIDWPR